MAQEFLNDELGDNGTSLTIHSTRYGNFAGGAADESDRKIPLLSSAAPEKRRAISEMLAFRSDDYGNFLSSMAAVFPPPKRGGRGLTTARNDSSSPQSSPGIAAVSSPPPSSSSHCQFMTDDARAFGKTRGTLGKGSFAVVELHVSDEDKFCSPATGKKTAYAVKRIDGSRNADRLRCKAAGYCDGSALREASIGCALRDSVPHVVCAQRAYRDPRSDSVALLMHLECGVSFADAMSSAVAAANGSRDPRKFDTSERLKQQLLCALSGMAALHALGISHSDIKSNNIVATDRRASLVDLGLACTPWTPNRRTPERSYNADFRAPEFCLGLADVSNPAARAAGDVWAMGCIIVFGALGRDALFGSRSAANKKIATALAAGTPPRTNEETVALLAAAFGLVDSTAVSATSAEDRTSYYLDRAKFPRAAKGGGIFGGGGGGNSTTATSTGTGTGSVLSISSSTMLAMGRADNSQAPPIAKTLEMRMAESGVSIKLRDLLRRMLCFDPRNRCTAAKACAHPYFSAVAAMSPPQPTFDVRWAMMLANNSQLPTMAAASARMVDARAVCLDARAQVATLVDALSKVAKVRKTQKFFPPNKNAKDAQAPAYGVMLARMRAEEKCAALYYRWAMASAMRKFKDRAEENFSRQSLQQQEHKKTGSTVVATISSAADGEKFAATPSIAKYATCHVVANSMFDEDEVATEAYCAAAPGAFKGGREGILSNIAAMMRDLDHELDVPTPSDCARLVLQCSNVLEIFRRRAGRDRGLLAFRRVELVATLLGCVMARDPTIASTCATLDAGCACLSLALGELAVAHPEFDARIIKCDVRAALPPECTRAPCDVSRAFLDAIGRYAPLLNECRGGAGDEFWLYSCALDRVVLEISDADARFASFAPCIKYWRNLVSAADDRR